MDSGDGSEALVEGVPSCPVFFLDLVEIGEVDLVEGGSGQLVHRGDAEPGLADLHGVGHELPVLADQGSDPGAAGGESLGHRVEENQVLVDLLDASEGGQRLVGVDELPVDLVRQQEQVMILYEVGDDLPFLRGKDRSGGIARVGEEHGPGPGSDQLFELFPYRVAVSFFRSGRDGHDLRSGKVDEGQIVGIEGLGHEELVAVVQDAVHGDGEGFAASGGDDDVGGGVVKSYLFIIVRNGVEKDGDPGGRSVGKNVGVIGPEGFL